MCKLESDTLLFTKHYCSLKVDTLSPKTYKHTLKTQFTGFNITTVYTDTRCNDLFQNISVHWGSILLRA